MSKPLHLHNVPHELAYAVMGEINTAITRLGHAGNRTCKMVFTGTNAREDAYQTLTKLFGEPKKSEYDEGFGRRLWAQKDSEGKILQTFWVSSTRHAMNDSWLSMEADHKIDVIQPE